ncbi:MAG: hypothetical protein NKF39_03660 [Tropheryma whipplei]|uniref:membrane protein n=1 Tax=Tropheryma whipplei TaxID=2039 RepID=UPI000000C7CA|nr:membrane protein [Tropheryma whipplei]MCO8182984.1 hypothetical protein [Tropheryma whipplei]CAD66869.1 possible integral membrane protein [Tropheryma whipplei TW08/27]
MPKTNIKFLIITLSVIFSLIFIATPTYATTSVTTDKAVATTTEPKANQIIKELEQAGFTKQVTGNKRQETITLTKDGVTVTLTHVTQQTQTRLSWGDDPWGFYIKLEWHEQVALAAGTLAAGGGAGLALKAALKIAVKAGTAFLAGLEVVDKLSDIIGAGPCPPFQPRYIRFDPFRTKCG